MDTNGIDDAFTTGLIVVVIGSVAFGAVLIKLAEWGWAFLSSHLSWTW